MEEIKSDSLEQDHPHPLNESPLEEVFLKNSSISKPLQKIIPIPDPYIAKLLLQFSDKFLNKFGDLAKNLGISFQIKKDHYVSSLELNSEEQENSKGIETISCEFQRILDEIKGIIKECKIPCNEDEYFAVTKCMRKGGISPEVDVYYSQNQIQKPMVLKEFVFNQGFEVQLVLIENSHTLAFEANDNLVLNITSTGIFLDDFMAKQRITDEIVKAYLEKKKEISKNDELLELNLPAFKLFLQVFSSLNLIEDENSQRKLTQIYIKQLFSRIFDTKQFINLYYALPVGLEQETIDIFFKELLKISKNCAEDQNFLMFPSKICFLCIDKQKESLFDYFNKIKQRGTLDDLPKELNYGGSWCILQENPNNISNNMVNMNQNNMNLGYFNRNFSLFSRNKLRNQEISNRRNEVKLAGRVSRIIERAFVMGEKQGVVLIDERTLLVTNENPSQNLNANPNLNQNSNLTMTNLNQNFYTNPNLNQNNQNNDLNFANEDEITIDLKNLIEKSKLTGYERPITQDTTTGMFMYMDINSGEFLFYDPRISRMLNFMQNLHCHKLFFHMDFETIGPCEALYTFDLTNMTLKLDQPSMDPENIEEIIKAIERNEQKQENNQTTYKLFRKKDHKFNNFTTKSLKWIKNLGSVSIVETLNGIQKTEDLSNKVPELIIRSIDDLTQTIQNIKVVLSKKLTTHFMKMKYSNNPLHKSLKELCFRNNIKCAFPGYNVLRLEGNRKTLNKLRPEIQRITEMNIEETNYPDFWDPQTENLKEVDVPHGSKEFIDITRAFLLTCFDFQILKITRIQNKKLWENYVFERKRLASKGNATEKMLFHGSRANDPKSIYSGIEEGFDLRLANVGTIGKGLYFAEDAAYSANGFAFLNSNGNSVLIYANVLVGEFCIGGNSTYVMPPMMPGESELRYDSVKHETNYIVYNGNRAYPGYIIEFKPPASQQNRFQRRFINNGLPQINNNVIPNNQGNYHDYISISDDDDYDNDDL